VTHDNLEQAQEQEIQLQDRLDLVNGQLNSCQLELSETMKQLGEKTRSLEATQNNLVICQEKIQEVEERCLNLEYQVEQQEAHLIGMQAERSLLKEELVKAEVNTKAVQAFQVFNYYPFLYC